MMGKLKSQFPTKETVAFTRYADRVNDPDFKEKLQFPMGEPLRRIDPAKELFRVQKTSNHWEQVARSKQFLAEDFFPPRAVPFDTNVQEIFADASLVEEELCERLTDLVPNLNHDSLIELALYVALERPLNSLELWRAIETAALEALHLLSLKQVCQLEWATT